MEEISRTSADIQTYVNNLSSVSKKQNAEIQSLSRKDNKSTFDMGYKAFMVKHHNEVLSRLSNASILLKKVTEISDSDTLVDRIERQLISSQSDGEINNDIILLEEESLEELEIDEV